MEQQQRVAASWASVARYGVTACRRCGGRERQHEGRGLCAACYNWVAHRWERSMDACPYPALIAQRQPAPPYVRRTASLAPTSAALRAIGGPRARLAHRLLVAAQRCWGVPLAAIVGPSRDAGLTEPRRILAYVLVHNAGLTRCQAATVLQRDHSTLCHHLERLDHAFQRGNDGVRERIAEVVRESIPATDGIYRPDHWRTATQAAAARRRVQAVAS